MFLDGWVDGWKEVKWFEGLLKAIKTIVELHQIFVTSFFLSPVCVWGSRTLAHVKLSDLYWN